MKDTIYSFRDGMAQLFGMVGGLMLFMALLVMIVMVIYSSTDVYPIEVEQLFVVVALSVIGMVMIEFADSISTE